MLKFVKSWSPETETTASRVAKAVQSIQIHNMAQPITYLVRDKVLVNFWSLPIDTQHAIVHLIKQKHWSNWALCKIITNIPDQNF